MNASSILLATALKLFWVDAYDSEPILPDSDPKGGRATNSLSLAAARGEIEAVSFVVNPDADYPKTELKASQPRTQSGDTLSEDAVDLSIVKVWFRPAGRWTTSWAGGTSNPTPINNLILHDDSLIKVDFENKVNWLRADYEDGSRYLNMSRTDRDTYFSHDLQPVSDAPRLLAFDLKKDFRQQFLATVKVPVTAKPGIYKFELTAVSGGLVLRTIPVELEVYPFKLPEPRTHYDTSKPYVSFWMGSPTLGGLLSGSRDLRLSEAKLRAIFRSMKEHNAVNLSGVGRLDSDSLDDYALRTLVIARQEGLCARPLISGRAYGDGGFVWNPGSELRSPEKDAELYKKSKADFRAAVEKQCAIMDKYLGHHECYYQSIDECGTGTNRRSLGYWSIIKELGGLVWTDYGDSYDISAMVDMNDVAAFMSHDISAAWHAGGAKCVTYAGPFTGPECPDMWRRTKGIRYWYADYDGLHEYSFFEGRHNPWNDFVRHDAYCQFGIVYWTKDGLVSTLAWEGVREALDDVKYYTLLRRRAEAAMKSPDRETRELGRAAFVWQDSVDPEYVIDLYAFRKETVGWIMRLIEKVGEEGEENPTELPPPALPECAVGAEMPSAVEDLWSEVFKFSGKDPSHGGENRFDLSERRLRRIIEFGCASDKVKAAIYMQKMFSIVLKRREAVKVIESVLALPGITRAERGDLLLAKMDALMTDAIYEEEYSKAQLDEAAAVLAAALKMPGVSEQKRFASIQKMVDRYIMANAFKEAIDYKIARFADTKIADRNKAFLCISEAMAWKRLGEWRKACKAYDEARRLYNDNRSSAFRRKICLAEAEAAEKVEDWKRAQRCYADIIPVYSDTDEKSQKKAAQANLVRVTKLVNANERPEVSMEEDEDVISLDE